MNKPIKVRTKVEAVVILLLLVGITTISALEPIKMGTDSDGNTWATTFDIPVMFYLWESGGTYYAKNATTSYIWSGSDGDVIIQSCVDGLTTGRTNKEKIIITGNFTIDTSITLYDYTTLEVNGNISFAANSDTYMFINSDTTNGNSYIDIIGGTYYGNGPNQGGICAFVWFDHVQLVNIHYITAIDFLGHGIYLDDFSLVDIAHCNFLNCGRTTKVSNIYMNRGGRWGDYGSFAGTVSHCFFDPEGTENYCIKVNTNYDTRICNNYFYTGDYGIYGGDSNLGDLFIENNYFDMQGENAIYCIHPNGLLIANNEIEESAKHGIYLKLIEKTISIHGNKIYDAGKSADVTYDGIYIESTYNTTDPAHKYMQLIVNDNIIRCKHLTSYGTDKRTRYGINVMHNVNNMTIQNNYFEGGKAAWSITSGGTGCNFINNRLGVIAADNVTYSNGAWKVDEDLYINATDEIIFSNNMTQMFKMSNSGTWSYLRGVGSAGCSMRFQPEAGTPYIDIIDDGDIQLHGNAGDYISFYEGTTFNLKFYLTGERSIINASKGIVTIDDCLQLEAITLPTNAPVGTIALCSANETLCMKTSQGWQGFW